MTESKQDITEEEDASCGNPCPPHDACDDCADYWHRMRHEKLWEDGKGWSEKARKGWLL